MRHSGPIFGAIGFVLAALAGGGAIWAGVLDLPGATSTATAAIKVAAYPVSNAGSKQDRLSAGALDSLPVSTGLAFAPTSNNALPKDAAGAANTAAFALASLPQPSLAKPLAVKQPPAKPPAPSNALLNDAQIASIRSRLNLTPSQNEYWPEVETALRAVVKRLHEANKRAPRGAVVPVDAESPEVERLKVAAIPLLMRLRDDQKREVKMLARVMGLEAVVAQL